MILCLLYQGLERQALNRLEDLSNADGLGPEDFLLVFLVYRMTLTTAKDEKMFRVVCERLAGASAFDPFDRRVVFADASEYAYREGNANAVKELGDRLHRITKWSILGPFDNTSSSGHRKDFLNTTKLDGTKEYTGKAGQKFRWQAPPVLSLLGTINFDNHFHRSKWITAYAGTQISVKERGTWILSVSKAGSCIVDLDGKRLLDTEERSYQEEYHHFEVTLDKGQHALLIKVSSGDIDPSLAVAFSTEDGKPASGVQFAPLVPSTPMKSGTEGQPSPLPMYQALEAAAPADSLSPRPAFWDHLAQARPRPLRMYQALETAALADSLSPGPAFWHLLSLTFFDLHEEAARFGARAIEHFPKSALIRYAAASALATGEDPDASRLSMDRLSDIDPDFSQAVMWKAREKMRRKLFTQADSLLIRATEHNPDFVRARFALLDSYKGRGVTQEAFALAQKLASNFPDYRQSYDFLADYYATIDPGKSRKYRHQALECSPFTVGWVAEVTRAAEKEDLGDLRKLLEKMVELSPDSPLFLAELAAVMLRQGDANGLKLADQAVERFPYSMDALSLKAEVADPSIGNSIPCQDPCAAGAAAGRGQLDAISLMWVRRVSPDRRWSGFIEPPGGSC